MAKLRAESEIISRDFNARICKFYVFSSCKEGNKCLLSHDVSEEQAKSLKLCHFFLKGKCLEGDKCPRFHDSSICLNGTKKKPCIYFSQDKCRFGNLCLYSHASVNNCAEMKFTVKGSESGCTASANINKLCRFYQRGTCFFGNNCRNFHDNSKDLDTFFSELRLSEAATERQNSTIKKGRSLNENSATLTETHDIVFSSRNNVCSSSDQQRLPEVIPKTKLSSVFNNYKSKQCNPTKDFEAQPIRTRVSKRSFKPRIQRKVHYNSKLNQRTTYTDYVKIKPQTIVADSFKLKEKHGNEEWNLKEHSFVDEFSVIQSRYIGSSKMGGQNLNEVNFKTNQLEATDVASMSGEQPWIRYRSKNAVRKVPFQRQRVSNVFT